MNESILNSIKKMLGIGPEYDHFDIDIMIHINSTFFILHQLGMKNFSITGVSESWSDYLDDREDLDATKTYVFSKVKLLFDPPTTGPMIEALNNVIHEFEWRINVQAEQPQE